MVPRMDDDSEERDENAKLIKLIGEMIRASHTGIHDQVSAVKEKTESTDADVDEMLQLTAGLEATTVAAGERTKEITFLIANQLDMNYWMISGLFTAIAFMHLFPGEERMKVFNQRFIQYYKNIFDLFWTARNLKTAKEQATVTTKMRDLTQAFFKDVTSS